MAIRINTSPRIRTGMGIVNRDVGNRGHPDSFFFTIQ
jgi:hypothetical protein